MCYPASHRYQRVTSSAGAGPCRTFHNSHSHFLGNAVPVSFSRCQFPSTSIYHSPEVRRHFNFLPTPLPHNSPSRSQTIITRYLVSETSPFQDPPNLDNFSPHSPRSPPHHSTSTPNFAPDQHPFRPPSPRCSSHQLFTLPSPFLPLEPQLTPKTPAIAIFPPTTQINLQTRLTITPEKVAKLKQLTQQ